MKTQKPPTIEDVMLNAHPVDRLAFLLTGEPIPFDPPEAIKRRVRALAKKAKVDFDDVVGFAYQNDDAPLAAGRSPVGNRSGVLVPFGFWENPPALQRGVIAHELAHIKFGHIDRGDPRAIATETLWEHEYEADRFAVELGVGKGLLEALRIHEAEEPKEIKNGSWSHPPMWERIRRIEEMLRKEGKKAA